MSIPQPDPASPAQVAEATFSTGRRGFDQGEVRDFLRTVSAELTRLHDRQAYLERELDAAQSDTDLSTAHLDDETLTRLLGEETVRILNAARESSHEIREKAERAAAQMLMEASAESIRLREEAEIEASRRRSDAANDAEAELSMAKQQGREMVNEARAYRERVLSELARRRELAREQIEQLVHGRDRLMQAFERARLVAVDVVAEMQPLGEPDEYVNLQPSTGPVPVMVARQAMAPTEQGDTADGVADGTTGVGIYDHTTDPGDAVVETVVADGADGADDADDDTVVDDEAPTSSDDEPSGEIDADEMAEVVELKESVHAGADVDAAADGDGDGDESETETETDEASVVLDPVDEHPDTVGDTAVESDPNGDGDMAGDADLAGAADPEAEEEHSGGVDREFAVVEVLRANPDHGSVDDVVVDLFARLRATNDAPAHVDDEMPDDETRDVDGARDDAAPDDAAPDDAADDDEAEPTPFEQRDADLTPLIVSSARKLKRVLADEQNEVLDALRRSDPVRNLDGLLPWANHHAERYSGAISDELLAAANAGAALTTGTPSSKLRSAAGKQAVQQAAETIARGMVAPLRDRLERCIADGDGDNAAITKKVRAVYREFKTQHIDEQLDDVLRAAHGRGVLASFELDTPIQWMPDPNHDICADCDDNRLEGAVAAGQPFPTGHLCAPAHPGCRCLLAPAGR